MKGFVSIANPWPTLNCSISPNYHAFDLLPVCSVYSSVGNDCDKLDDEIKVSSFEQSHTVFTRPFNVNVAKLGILKT